MKNKVMLFLFALVFASPAYAQDFSNAEFIKNTTQMMSDHVKGIYWGTAAGYDGAVLKMDIHNPDVYHIPEEEEQRVVMAGINNGRFKWCGMDTDAYFRLFLQRQKIREMWNEYQMAYISLLTSSSEQFILTMMRASKRTCNDAIRNELKEGRDAVMAQWTEEVAQKLQTPPGEVKKADETTPQEDSAGNKEHIKPEEVEE